MLSNGFKVTINLNIKKIIFRLTTDSFKKKVLIHYLPSYPDVGERGFLVSPGFETHCGINPQSSYNSPLFDVLNVDERKCYLESENILQYYSHYSMSNCFAECLTDKMLSQCSCRPFYYAGNYQYCAQLFYNPFFLLKSKRISHLKEMKVIHCVNWRITFACTTYKVKDTKWFYSVSNH